MYPASVTGEKDNNEKFSACSISDISEVVRRSNCLNVISGVCGNKIVDEGEDCDPGHSDTKCCHKNCTFTKDSVCSAVNSICCTEDCSIAEKGSKVCREGNSLECNLETVCNGTSAQCPDKAPKKKSGPCLTKSFRKGHCNKYGVCESLCFFHGLASCTFPHGNNSCKVCCHGNDSDVCKLLPGNINENDQVECNLGNSTQIGICDNGTCRNIRRKLNVPIWNKVSRLLRNNIVITIIVLSTLLWIPFFYLIEAEDKKNESLNSMMGEDELLLKEE